LRAQESLYAASFFRFQQKEIERIVKRIRKDGLNLKTLVGPKKDDLFGFRKRLRADLRNNLEQTRNFGVIQVRREIERQA
jgi:hypothetical protein